jgi:hypothetical protein
MAGSAAIMAHKWLDGCRATGGGRRCAIARETRPLCGRRDAAAQTSLERQRRLPSRVNRVLDSLASNELKLKVEMIDEGAVIDGLQKVANRIALGLVLAAMIVAAAVIMQVPTTFRLFGYPGLAMILFLAAATGGALLAAQIVTHDRTTTRE